MGPLRPDRGLLGPEIVPFTLYGPPKTTKCLFSWNVSSKTMQCLVVLIGRKLATESEESAKFLPLLSPWLRHWLLGAFLVTRNTSSRTLGTLLTASAILATRLPREPLAGSTFSNCLAPHYQLHVLLAPLRPPQCSASSGCWTTSLVIRHPPGHGYSLGCLAPHSSVPFHPFCVLLAARHPSGHSALPGYSAPSWILGALRRPPSHSAISCLL